MSYKNDLSAKLNAIDYLSVKMQITYLLSDKINHCQLLSVNVSDNLKFSVKLNTPLSVKICDT